jgi:rsbT co-antagonist protein RsbR
MFRLIGGSSVITAMLIVVTSLFPPLFAPPLKLVIDVLNVITVLVIMMLLVFFFGFIWQQLTTRLERMRVINADLNTLRADLERQVAARTGDLEQALVQVKAQAAEQAQLLAENEQQRTLIREMSVPILPVSGTTLVMPLVGALDSRRLLDMREQALLALQRLRAKTLLLDLTGVPLVDTQVAEGLIGVVTASRLLGAEVVLIGIRPEVAQTIVSLGVDLHSVRTISDLQSALAAQYTTRSGMPMPGQL